MNNKFSCEIGIIGLGVMGRNLLLNMADHGFTVAGYDNDPNKVKNLQRESKSTSIHQTSNIKEFIELLSRPCAIMLLVPAGPIVDTVIQELLPHLKKGDLIIDAGNSYFKDTDTRTKNLLIQGIQFLGIGISGGAEGARLGPSIMPGGSKEAYERIHVVLEAIAAKVKGEPCVQYLGKGASGHFVKMVHNGIEYGIMQLISETYDFMKKGLGLNNNQLKEIYQNWNKGELNSYLIEITSHIFEKRDDKSGKSLIDMISDIAKQMGTGMWTAQSGMELQVPVPTIDVAVSMRDLSVFAKKRADFSSIYQRPIKSFTEGHILLIKDLEYALYVAMTIVYAQGMDLLGMASNLYQYQLSLANIAQIWRGGCIIRAALLEDISSAYRDNGELSNILLSPNLSKKINKYQNHLRKVVSQSAEWGIPIPALMSALAYLDAFRCKDLPTNLIQAQRDYFGSHQYERIDEQGSFHTEWVKK